MPDCAQQLIDIGICEDELNALEQLRDDKEVECMGRWMIYWMECEMAATASSPLISADWPPPGDQNGRCARRAKRLVALLRARGYVLERRQK